MITLLDKKPTDRHIVSASQVKTFARCQRKWGFKYIDKLPDPPGKGAIFGSAVHNVLEAYFERGTRPDGMTREGKLAQHAIESGCYPLGKVDFKVETHFVFEVEGVAFQGFVDLTWEDPIGLVVCDHKTSSDPKKYGLPDGAALREDTQAIIYAMWGIDRFKRNSVELRWVYMQTAQRVTPKIFSRETMVSRPHVENRFRLNILPTAKAITAAKATASTGNDLEPNPAACGDFGGCKFADHCILNRDQKLTSVFGKEESTSPMAQTLREIMAARQGNKLPPPRVNSPEHTAGVEASKEVSKAIGQASGGRDAQRDTARSIANATADETDPAEAKAKAEAALGVAEADRSAKAAVSMTQKDILLALFYGNRSEGISVSCSKAKATKAAPYSAGRTVAAMGKNNLLTIEDTDAGTKVLRITGRGLTAAEAHVKPAGTPATAPATQVPEPTTSPMPPSARTPVAPSPSEPKTVRVATGERIVLESVPDGDPVTKFLHASPEKTRPVIDTYDDGHATFFRALLSNTEIETTDAVAKFDAYAKRFPIGGA